MSKSINLPLRSDVPLSDQCSHGKTWDEFCRDCRIVWLQESLRTMEPQVKRDRAELEHLVGPCGCHESYPQLQPGVINHGPGCLKRIGR